MKKIILGLLLCLILSGCVGGGVIIPKSTRRYHWEIPSTNTNVELYTSSWLTTHYGKPTAIRTNDIEEVWTYRSGRRWAGIMPMVIVPIPLAVPVGKDKTEFVLRGDHIVNITECKQRTVGGAIGFVMGPCGAGFGAFPLEGFPK